MSDFHYPSHAYSNCRWCRGRGCLACAQQEEAARVQAAKPIFTADLDKPEEVEQLQKVFGAEALIKAFGPDGGGLREVEMNAAIAMLVRAIRTQTEETQEDSSS